MDLPIPLEVALDFADDSYTEVTFCNGEVEVWLQWYQGYQIVAFRGTEADGLLSKRGFRDITRDLRAYPWKDRRIGWCHAGFLKGARGITDGYLIPLMRRDVPLVILGHSLGGGLSVPAAAFMRHAGFDIAAVVTFGCPRVFYPSAFERYQRLHIPTFQYVNPGDPVPHVPFAFLGCLHAAAQIDTGRPRDSWPMTNHGIAAYKNALTSVEFCGSLGKQGDL